MLTTWKELVYRLSIVTIASIIILIIEAHYINELIVLLFDPIKELHNDWHNRLILHMINGAFEIFDKESQPEYITEYTVEYIPSCEITIQSTVLNKTVTILAIHVSIITIATVIWYNVTLYTVPSMFIFEKKIYIYEILWTVAIFATSIWWTHCVWTHIFLNISFHNYSEFNYYEFDVDFDLHTYVCKYIYTTYITFSIVWFTTTKKPTRYKNIIIFLIALAALQIIQIFEIGYFMFIAIKCLESHRFLEILNKKRNNLYKLEQ